MRVQQVGHVTVATARDANRLIPQRRRQWLVNAVHHAWIHPARKTHTQPSSPSRRARHHATCLMAEGSEWKRILKPNTLTIQWASKRSGHPGQPTPRLYLGLTALALHEQRCHQSWPRAEQRSFETAHPRHILTDGSLPNATSPTGSVCVGGSTRLRASARTRVRRVSRPSKFKLKQQTAFSLTSNIQTIQRGTLRLVRARGQWRARPHAHACVRMCLRARKEWLNWPSRKDADANAKRRTRVYLREKIAGSTNNTVSPCNRP